MHPRGWFAQLKTSYDEEFSERSPGAIVVDRSVRQAFEAGYKEFDFLGDMDRHKLAWTAKSRTHVDYFLFGKHPFVRFMSSMKRLKRAMLRPGRHPSVKPD